MHFLAGVGVVGFWLILLVYFAPSSIAMMRHKANAGAIFALNLLAGWTFIGWVGALVWACSVDQRRTTEEHRSTLTPEERRGRIF